MGVPLVLRASFHLGGDNTPRQYFTYVVPDAHQLDEAVHIPEGPFLPHSMLSTG